MSTSTTKDSQASAEMTSRDQAILDMVMSGGEWVESEITGSNSSKATAASPMSEENTSSLPPERLAQLQSLEGKAVQAAEKDDLSSALDYCNQAIALESTYASAYNNKAQILRMKKEPKEALEALNLAIRYGQGDKRTLRQAYTQRGILRKEMGDQEGSASDFEMGAKYGQHLAKAVATAENPYAKLCHAMVMESLRNEGAI